MRSEETLERRLARGALPLDEAVRVGLALLSALAALHERGLVHGDLRPANVELSADGGVTLLGAAQAPRVSLAGGTPLALAATGIAKGTFSYMAPEQALGREVDRRADLFSLAAVIHEAIRGARAFPGVNAVEATYAVLHLAPPPLGGPPNHAAVGRVLERALAKEPAARPGSAAAMAAELRAALAGGGPG